MYTFSSLLGTKIVNPVFQVKYEWTFKKNKRQK